MGFVGVTGFQTSAVPISRHPEPDTLAAFVLRLRVPRFGSDAGDSTKVDIEPRLRDLAEELGLDADQAVQVGYQIRSEEPRLGQGVKSQRARLLTKIHKCT